MLKNTESKYKSEAKSPTHGEKFHNKLVLFIAFNKLNQYPGLKISIEESDKYGKFDDICVQLGDDTQNNLILIQAKHKVGTSKKCKVNKNEIWTPTGPFSLPVYLDSFAKLIQTTSYLSIQKIYLVTNANFKKELKETVFEQVPDNNFNCGEANKLKSSNLEQFKAEMIKRKEFQMDNFENLFEKFISKFIFLTEFHNEKELDDVNVEELRSFSKCNLELQKLQTSKDFYKYLLEFVQRQFEENQKFFIDRQLIGDLFIEFEANQAAKICKAATHKIKFVWNELEAAIKNTANQIVIVRPVQNIWDVTKSKVFQYIFGIARIFEDKVFYIQQNKFRNADELQNIVDMILKYKNEKSRYFIVIEIKSADLNKVQFSREDIDFQQDSIKIIIISANNFENFDEILKLEDHLKLSSFDEKSKDLILKYKLDMDFCKVPFEQIIKYRDGTEMERKLEDICTPKLLNDLIISLDNHVTLKVLKISQSDLKNDLDEFYIERTLKIMPVEKQIQGVKKISEPTFKYFINNSNENPEHETFSENEIFEKFKCFDNSIVLIAELGEGKSCLLVNLEKTLAEKYRNENNFEFILHIRLIQIQRILYQYREYTNEHFDKMQTFAFLTQLLLFKSKTDHKYFIIKLFKWHVEHQNTTLMLDGIDEVMPKHTEVILGLIKSIQMHFKNVRVLSTSRPSLKVELLQKTTKLKLGLEKMKIMEIQKYFEKFWNTKPQISTLTDVQIKELSHYLTLKLGNLIYIPLFLGMAAEILLQYIQSDPKDLVMLINSNATTPLIYKHYIENVIKRHVAEKYRISPSDNQFDERLKETKVKLFKDHHILLLKYLGEKYPEFHEKTFTKYKKEYEALKEEVKASRKNYGCMYFDENSNDLYFIHISYAEYFLAHSLLHMKFTEDNSTIGYFLTDIMFTSILDNLRKNILYLIRCEMTENSKSTTCLDTLKQQISSWIDRQIQEDNFGKNWNRISVSFDTLLLCFFGTKPETRKVLLNHILNSVFVNSIRKYSIMMLLSLLDLVREDEIDFKDIFMKHSSQILYADASGIISVCHILGSSKTRELFKFLIQLIKDDCFFDDMEDPINYLMIIYFKYEETLDIGKLLTLKAFREYQENFVETIEDENEKQIALQNFRENSLFLSSLWGTLDVVKHFLDDLSMSSENLKEIMRTCVFLAIIRGKPEFLEFFHSKLQQYWKGNRNKWGDTPLMFSLISYPYVSPEVFEDLEIEAKNYNGENALTVSISHYLYITAKKLLEMGANVNCQNGYGFTPLMILINNMNYEENPQSFSTLSNILSKKPNIIFKSHLGETAISLAVLCEFPELICTIFKNDVSTTISLSLEDKTFDFAFAELSVDQIYEPILKINIICRKPNETYHSRQFHFYEYYACDTESPPIKYTYFESDFSKDAKILDNILNIIRKEFKDFFIYNKMNLENFVNCQPKIYDVDLGCIEKSRDKITEMASDYEHIEVIKCSATFFSGFELAHHLVYVKIERSGVENTYELLIYLPEHWFPLLEKSLQE